MKKAIKIIGNILMLLSIVFVAYKLYKTDMDWSSVFNNSALVPLSVAGLFIAVASVFFLGYIWSRTVSCLSNRKDITHKAVSVYARANLAKYIPGNVVQYVERNLFLTDSGLDQLDIAVSSIAEIIGLLLAGVLISLIFGLEFFKAFVNKYINKTVLITIIIIIILLLAVLIISYNHFEKVKQIFRRLFSKKFFKTFIVNIILSIFALLMISTIMLLTYMGINRGINSISEAFMIISAYSISWIAGFVVIGAPGGIGIRELVISFLITDPTMKAMVLLAAVIQRVINILGDISAFALASIKHRDKQ